MQVFNLTEMQACTDDNVIVDKVEIVPEDKIQCNSSDVCSVAHEYHMCSWHNHDRKKPLCIIQ